MPRLRFTTEAQSEERGTEVGGGPEDRKALAIECKYQDSVGTVDETIPYALQDLEAL